MSDARNLDERYLSLPRNAEVVLADQVGTVSHVALTTIIFSPLKATEPPITIGELLAVGALDRVIIGEVDAVDATDGDVRVTVTLTTTVDQRLRTVTPGVTTNVAHGAAVHRPDSAVIKAMLEGRTSLDDDQVAPISITVGASPLCPHHPLSFTPERLFGRHCAVVGTSGSGKSWTMARLMEQCAAQRAKVIILDPSGEYRALTGPVRHVHIGSSPFVVADSDPVSLPYFELTEADLVAILRPTNSTQVTKLRAAIRSLKLLQFDSRLGVDGNLPKAHRVKTPYELAFNDYREEVCRPDNGFNITSLPMQIGLECVDPIRSHTESNYWGGVNATDHNACVPMINTLEDLLQSSELQCLLRPSEGESLITAIEHFLLDPQLSVLHVSCEYLPTINRVREIMANAVARQLLGIARTGRLRTTPLILAVDEAHQVLPKSSSLLSAEYPLEAFNVIAKEGRKYGLTLCIATQRPGDIPDDVLSQVGTFLVHRLVSDIDRGSVERASGNMSAILKARLPLLAPGEAFLIGVDFQAPLRILVSRPLTPPSSEGPNYQGAWSPGDLQ